MDSNTYNRLTIVISSATGECITDPSRRTPVTFGENMRSGCKIRWAQSRNKKVLLRERKRHTARRVAIAISCYSGGGGSLDKNFSPSLNMYQAKSGVKNFSLYWGGGGGPRQNFFFPVWTCIKPNLVSKIFPFTGGGGPSTKNFFPSLNMYQAKIWCQKFFPLLGGGGSLDKNFFPVWTYIKPNLVSKIFPFTGGGGPSTKNFFPSLNIYQAKSGVKKFSLYWDRVPPPENMRPGTPPPENLRPGTPPEQTHTCENITSRRTYVRGR